MECDFDKNKAFSITREESEQLEREYEINDILTGLYKALGKVGVIFVTMSITVLIFCATMAFASWNANWLWAWIPFIIFITIGEVLVSETPTEGDVLKGKVHYVEVYHTYGNDTIKTYHLNCNKRPIEGGSHR